MLKQAILLSFLFTLLTNYCLAQKKDSLLPENANSSLLDSLPVKDSLLILNNPVNQVTVIDSVQNPLQKILDDNLYLNSSKNPLSFIQSKKKVESRDILFYTLLLLVFVFALLKYFYSRYLTNLFRVFFNTSLRQSQLTDQLLQAKLPSLLFNILFILIGGAYLYLVLNYFGKLETHSKGQVILICTTSLALIYFVKYLVIKFTGWITGYKQEADTYIFIVFLINKIVAICLIPLLVIVAFSDKKIVDIALVLTYVIIGLMVSLRYFRSYNLLQNRLKVSRFHFFIYIIGIEIIPLALIYKAALLFMSKNL